MERILENANHLKDHPEHAAPRCQGRCPLFCTFKRARKRVDKVRKHRDDQEKLKKLGKRFHDLGKAYAAVLRLTLADRDQLEYLQNVNTPQGKVPIAPWTKAPAPCHVGLQHRHDPALRLLSTVPFLSGDDVVYTTDQGLVCAHDGVPPEESRRMLVEALGIRQRSEGQAACPHADQDPPKRPIITLTWPEDSLVASFCPACGPGSALTRLQTRMASKEPLQIVTVDVELPPMEDPEGPGVPGSAAQLPDAVLRRYAGGQLSDQGLTSEAAQARAARLQATHEPVVVLGDRLHRPPYEDLVDSLGAEPPVDRMVQAVLDGLQRPVVLDKGTAVELLHRAWADHGEAALRAVLGEDGLDLYDPAANPDDLERLVRQVDKRRSSQRVAEELPHYEHIPAPADLADTVARAVVSGGAPEAQRHLTSPPDREHQAMALALVRALELPSPSWTIDPREHDMAELLEEYARELFQARGEEYHEALVTLLKATGSTQRPVRAD